MGMGVIFVSGVNRGLTLRSENVGQTVDLVPEF